MQHMLDTELHHMANVRDLLTFISNHSPAARFAVNRTLGEETSTPNRPVNVVCMCHRHLPDCSPKRNPNAGSAVNRTLGEAMTIEHVIETALHKGGFISEANFGSFAKVRWSRASRTDKGVHSLGTVSFSADRCCHMCVQIAAWSGMMRM